MQTDIWIGRSGERYGPYTKEQVESWVLSGHVARTDNAWSEMTGWTTVAELLRPGSIEAPGMPPPMPPPASGENASRVDTPDRIATQVADYERISAIIWSVIAMIQILSLVGIIAGLWNAFAAYTRFQWIPLIRARDSRVPEAFESITGLVVIGIINLIFGGVIGVIGVVMDFVVRDYVLKNRAVFDQTGAARLPT